jgi:hypothetical protein
VDVSELLEVLRAGRYSVIRGRNYLRASGVSDELMEGRLDRTAEQSRSAVGTLRVTQADLLRRRQGMTGARRVKSGRPVDPRRAGQLECALWVAYYRREWVAFLRTAVFLMDHVLGLPWRSTLRGSWFLLRATQLWAPCPDNNPTAARLWMERFYRVLKQHSDEPFDPAEAARLEVAWWHVHRECQHSNGNGDEQALVDALAALYAYALGVPYTAVRRPAEQRALAMRYCDQWVREGCDLESSLIARGRAALVRSYTGLVAAVDEP